MDFTNAAEPRQVEETFGGVRNPPNQLLNQREVSYSNQVL